MEGNQESSSKPLTKSSRKRLRKRQAAALEKFMLASEAAGSCKIEPIQGLDTECVEIRGECLNSIVFHSNSVGEKEYFVSSNSPHDIVNTKTKSVCCEGSENVLLEKKHDTTQEASVPQSKRKRSGKKAVVTEISSDDPSGNLTSKIKKTVEAQCAQHKGAPPKDSIKQERSVLSSLNHPIVSASIVAKTDKSINKVEAANKLDNCKKQEETDDKTSTLSRSKRKRNRKKATALLEQCVGNRDQFAEHKEEGVKAQGTPECPEHLTEQSSPHTTHTPELCCDTSTLIHSGIPASDAKIGPVKNNSALRCEKEVTGKTGKCAPKKEGKLQLSKLPERSDGIGKKICEPCHKIPSEGKKGLCMKEVEVQESPSKLENKETATIVSEFNLSELDQVDVAKAQGCHLMAQKEQSQSSFFRQKIGDCPPISFCVSAEENFAIGMEGTQKNIPRVGQVPKESNKKEKGENKVKIFSKSGSVAKKVAPAHCDEVDRASTGKNEIRILSEMVVCIESKKEENVSTMPEIMTVVNKVTPTQSEVLDETVCAMDSTRIEEKLESPKKGDNIVAASLEVGEKSKEKIKAEREARKATKLAKKQKDKTPAETKAVKQETSRAIQSSVAPTGKGLEQVVGSVEEKTKVLPPQESEKASAGKSKAELRAERRAKQEAQRAAKTATVSNKATPTPEKEKSVEQGVPNAKPSVSRKDKPKTKAPPSHKLLRQKQGVKLLSRLGWGDGRLKRSTSEDTTLKETQTIHPAIVQLSTRFMDRIVSGSNARCLAFVQAIKKAILDYQTPPQKELGRDLEARLLTPSLAYLEAQRPHAISVLNATKFLKWQLTQLQPPQQCSLEISPVPHAEGKKTSVTSDDEAKKTLIEGLDAYIWEKIEVAERAVCYTLRDKIKDGDVILTYGCSYLLQQILTGAKISGTVFKVVVVDGRPWREGREMLRCLVAIGIPCSYVLLSAASSVMRQVNKVLLGAHALLSNGYVMSRVGVSQVALLASAHNVPVLVACETHKFCERVQSDSFVYNEMGEPDGLAQLLGGEDGPLSGWRSIPSLSLLNLSYDVTPPELVTAVATELAVLPCTSVPVVLRVRPAEPIASRH